MPDGDGLAALLTLLATALGAGWAWSARRAVRLARTLEQVREERARLAATLEAERAAAARSEEDRRRLEETFRALAGDALRANSEGFMQLAGERLRAHLEQAERALGAREQAIEALLRPLREALERTDRQLRELEAARREAYGALTQQLRQVAETQRALHDETRRLVQALRRPEVRGQWGELTLRRLVELAGMTAHCDFYEQETRGSGPGALRPDMVVRLPEGREVVVDAKTPLDAYLSAVEATDEAIRRSLLQRHARNLRERVRALAAKAYWAQFPKAPDFVVLFIPGDPFLSAALEVDPRLIEDALAERVILATPTSFMALLRAIGYGWRQAALADNAERIRESGKALYERLAAFTGHLGRIGRGLGSAVDAYNRAVGSLERSVLPGARRLAEMGITARREMDTPEPVEKAPRPPAAEPDDGDDTPP